MKLHRNRHRVQNGIFIFTSCVFTVAGGVASAQPPADAPAPLPGQAPLARRAARPKTAPQVAAPRLETLEARVSKADFAGGEPVYLDVTLINRSTKPAAFLMLGPKLEFKLKRDGKNVGLTYRAKDESKGDKISYRMVPVGEKFAYRVMLSRVFDLSRAGIYTLACSKYLSNEARDPGADLVGPVIVAQGVKFSVSDADFEPTGVNK